MNGYYTRKRTNTAHGQLLHNNRYYPARSNTRPLKDPDTTRATAPLRFSLDDEQFERNTIAPRRRAEQTTRVLSPDQRTTRGTNPLPSPASTMRDYAPRSSSQMMLPPETPRSDRKREPENKKNTSLLYHIVRIALGIWTLFMDMPPWPRLVCIFLVIGLLLLVSPIASAAIQITMPLFASVYVILGIIAAIIVIYEFMNRT